MFINLNCKKGEDFYITSSEVVRERYFELEGKKLTDAEVLNELFEIAKMWAEQGYDIKITREEF